MFKEKSERASPSEHPPVREKKAGYVQTRTHAELPHCPRPSEHPPVRGGKCQNV